MRKNLKEQKANQEMIAKKQQVIDYPKSCRKIALWTERN